MCGISGIVYKKDNSNVNDIKNMTNAIEHRGPDDEGFFIEDNIALGHRRLSILDLSSHGHQPMFYDNQQYVLTYNGEMYNYLELKEELLSYGYRFESDTDSEVILAAYDKWGYDCLKRFNGMWAFAILDKKCNKIFMSRDRFGIKPFYYYNSDDGFYFGSEIKQFLSLDNFPRDLNKETAIRFLSFGELNTTNETFFKDVYELKGGHYIEFDLQERKFQISQWYNPNNIKKRNISFEEANKEFFNKFKNSVNLRLRSDVEVGCLLSGGLDSSAIVGMVDSLVDTKINTISSCFEEKKYDEQEYIDEVIKEKNVIPHKIFPNLSELFSVELIDELVWCQDQPISSSSHFAEYLVFKAAKDNNLKVVLDGQGSDESLAGYHEFFPVYLLELLKKMKFTKFFHEVKYIQKFHHYKISFLVKNMLLYMLPDMIEDKIRDFFGKPHIPMWINIDKDKRKHITKKRFSKIDLQKYSLNQILVRSVPYQLHSEDRNSMAHSIESRIPFLDYQLVEFILSLPSELKVADGTTKFILRESLEGILPLKIKNRQNKMGFVTPEEVWMKNNPQVVKNELEKAVVNSKGLISDNIIKDFDQMVRGEKGFSREFFRVISFSRWIEKFEVKVS